MCQAPISGAAALDLDLAPWVCPQCTYVNECGPEKCGACEGPRPEQPPTPVDYTSAIASIQTEVEQHDLCRSLARAIVEYG
ncbi:hypothetical protein BVRB_039010 [Beta vulgaris subsp. vulgaris]|uniref:RanBP2-type domain-containing protein n=1 Tax=Beta vulgaris subsp. vulgaris TaxID=3555 RepID=A0A0J7YNI8_BETVV|nr:hypothetical protein BVRB_039010 [Beta vulgaris subsp. vulgaris]